MRMLALPAAFLLAFCLYLPFPSAENRLSGLIDALYRRFHEKTGGRQNAPVLFLLLLGAAASLLGAVHPAAAALVMAPLFTAPAVIPACAKMKDELDSGRFIHDIPQYEEHVRISCASLAPAFLCGAVAPALVCAIGMPLYIGCGLGWIYTAARRLHPESAAAGRILVAVLRISDKVFCFLMALCSGVVGRNPLRTKGRDAKARLLSILGIAQDSTATHSPMSGDIAQGIFLCCFCTALLLLSLTVIGFAF